MKNKEIKITKESVEFEHYFRVEAAEIEEKTNGELSGTYTRFKLSRKDASAVLVYNQETDKIILVRQFRYPVAHKISENILEIPAGKIDAGETPIQAATRELKEEIGYEVDASRLRGPIAFYPAPGYSTETIYVFFVSVTNRDKVTDGGGVEGEHENIEIVEMSCADFKSKIASNEIKDAKTIISTSYLS